MVDRVFLLDRSGSMQSCYQETLDGMNAFIESQREFGGTMTLCLFDTVCTTLYEKTPMAKVPLLTPNEYVLGGGTALHDAIGEVLRMSLGDTAMVIILTDGEENASSTYTAAHVKDLIELKPWTFVYLGANQDSVLNAQRLGIRYSKDYDGAQTPELFRTISHTVTQYSQNTNDVVL